MFKYETHLHTSPVSRCARATVEENLLFYKSLGYDGVFITNHFLDGNIQIDRSLPYEEQIAYFFSDYEQGVEIGGKLGIKVFPGVEITYGGTDFLIYGLDTQWYLQHPEILTMEKTEELTLMMESGALVIQAHPFREAGYINHIRLFPRHVHGVEIINGCRSEGENHMAELYAEHYGLLPFAGSDNHLAAAQKRLAGMSFDTPICTVEDFVERIKSGAGELFTEAF